MLMLLLGSRLCLFELVEHGLGGDVARDLLQVGVGCRGQRDRSAADGRRQQAAQALAQARNIPLEEARQQVAAFEQQYQQTVDQAKQAATEAADTAASVVSTGTLVAFVALVLGAIAGWFGGRSGVVHPVCADGVMPRRRLA
jgi:hypothetical protein